MTPTLVGMMELCRSVYTFIRDHPNEYSDLGVAVALAGGSPRGIEQWAETVRAILAAEERYGLIGKDRLNE